MLLKNGFDYMLIREAFHSTLPREACSTAPCVMPEAPQPPERWDPNRRYRREGPTIGTIPVPQGKAAAFSLRPRIQECGEARFNARARCASTHGGVYQACFQTGDGDRVLRGVRGAAEGLVLALPLPIPCPAGRDCLARRRAALLCRHRPGAGLPALRAAELPEGDSVRVLGTARHLHDHT